MRYLAKLFTLFGSTLLTLSTLALTGLTGLYFFYSPQLPDSKDLHHIQLQVPLRIYSKDEQLIAEYGTKRRRPVRFEQIPERLRQAFIAIEDARYYEHQGIDLKGIARALYSVVSTGRASQGASTITMQLARNAFLGREKTLSRKLKETLLAFKLERTLRKDEILELYLNKIYLGNRAYGIAAAAETYYGKKRLEDLTLAQMAMIAGLPKAPSRYNPIANPKRAMIRRDYILKRMFTLGYIDQINYESALKEANTARVHKPEIKAYAPYLAEMVRSTIVEKYRDKAYTQGYHVYTTLDADIQKHATTALRKSLISYDRRHGYRGAEDHIDLDAYPGREEWLDKLAAYPKVADMQAALVIKTTKQQAELLILNAAMNGETFTLDLKSMAWAKPFITADRRGRKPKKISDVMQPGDIVRVRKAPQITEKEQKNEAEEEPALQWQLTQIPAVGGALVVMEPNNGAIRAVMGGFDYYHSKFNRATQAMRQPGSSFKPIVYSAAMARGFTPTSIVNDAPITVPGSDWKPKNFGGKYIGPTTLTEALAKSRNLVSIRLLRNAGIKHTINYATRFGYEKKHLPPNLTLALGTGLTTPVQMATAYSTFANGGFKVDSHFINRIEDSTGQLLYDARGEIKAACGDDIRYCPSNKKTLAEALQETETAENKNPPEPTTSETASPDTAASVTAEPEIKVPAATRIMDSRTNKHIVGMMHGVTQFGTAARAGRTLKRKDIAGKTGTTNDQKDSWFCGFTPEYVAVAWAGFDDMAELGDKETSTKIAVPMWIDLMQEVLRDRPEKPWKKFGDKLYRAKIDMDTGLPTENDAAATKEQALITQKAPAQETTQTFEYTSAQAATQHARQQQQLLLQQQAQQQLLQQQLSGQPNYNQQQQLLQQQYLQQQAQQNTPAAQPPQSESVEIPEQIF
ncbi:MAG: penicillin-binding protein 1A [Thiolinea sp.]